MMCARFLLRLPRRALLVGGRPITWIARDAGDLRDPREIEHRFGLHPHERAIARAIVERHPELWLYRADQRRASGDLVVVDVSGRAPSRACAVVELKQRVSLREVSPSHVQLTGHAGALAALVEAGVLDAGAPALTLLGHPSPSELRDALRRRAAGARSDRAWRGTRCRA